MKRFLTRVVAVAMTGGLVAVTACAHDDSTIFIRDVLAPPQTGGTCTYKPDPTSTMIFSGTLDVGFAASYRPVVLVGNQLIAQQKNDAFRTETSRVQLQGATVRLEDTNGTELASFTTLANGFVDPGSGTSPGFGLVEVTLVNPKTVDALRTQIPVRGTKKLVAYFKVFGTTLGGISVESNEASFPIDACVGCLVYFPPQANDTTKTKQPNCLLTGDVSSIKIPCLPGQDEPMDCRLCYSNQLCQPI